MRPTEVGREALQLVCGLLGRLQVNQNCVLPWAVNSSLTD
jgi:hypothetical protein